MKFRRTLLLGAVVLTVALPIWAGRVPYTGAADEFPNMEISAAVTRSPGTTLKAPVKTGFPPKAASAVAPGWADTIPYIGSAEESSNIAPSAKVTATSSQALIAPANAEFPAEPASAVVLTDSFETNNALDAGDLKPSSILDTFFTSSSDADARTTSLSDHDSFERASSISHAEKVWHAERTEYGEGRTGEHERKRRCTAPLK